MIRSRRRCTSGGVVLASTVFGCTPPNTLSGEAPETPDETMKTKEIAAKNEIKRFKEENEQLKHLLENALQEKTLKALIKENQKLLAENSTLKKSTIAKKLSVKAQKFYGNVYKAIKDMNKIGCYVNINTLFRFFKAIETPQSHYYPGIRGNALWGYYKDEETFEYR